VSPAGQNARTTPVPGYVGSGLVLGGGGVELVSYSSGIHFVMLSPSARG